MRAAAYVRVSDDGRDCDHQRQAIERAASARGDEIGAWFEDLEPSQKRDGAQLAELRHAISQGRVKRLYIFALDRLTREGIFGTFRHLEHFTVYRVELISLAEGLDFTGFAGEIAAAIFAAMAKQERARMKQRMASARIAAEKKGKRWGRPRKVDRVTLAAAQKLRGEGLSLRVIAARLKVKKATLQRALAGVYSRGYASAQKDWQDTLSGAHQEKNEAKETPPSRGG